MAAHLVSNSHGPHDLQDHASRTSHSAGLDAIETLKAVQGIINTYLANGGTDGRSTIPTPEPSPVPRFMEDAQHDVGLKARGEEAVRKDAGPTDAGPVTESAVIKEIVGDDGPHLGINVAKTNITSQAPQATHGVTLNEQDSSKLRGNTASTVPSASDMESGKPAGASLANEDSSADTKKPPPPPAMPGLDQDRLHGLVDDITRNVSQLATDDSARIKAATAALELAAVVRPPGDTIMSWFANMSVISAVRLFLHWGAFDIIPAAKGESITYSELASKLNAEDGLITRVASMLTASHILLHHPPIPSLSGPPSPSPSPSLSHTPTSLLLRAHQPMSAMFSLLYTNIAHVSTILPSYFDAHGRAEPRGPARIPTSVLAGHPDEDFFGLLKRDAPRLRDFGVAMRMTSRRVPVTGMYDMTAVLKECEDAKRETVWVDVGGGDGHTVGEFLERYPGLSAGRCVVQDLEEVVEAARGDARERGLEGVRWVGMDFMRDAPVEGALVYYLRHIVRDYSDPVCTTILRNVARALTDPAGRVLISEQIHPDVTGMPGPPPLYAAFKDFSMLSIGGKERSLKQFAALADAAGLRVSRVFRDGATPHAVIELALKEVGEVGGEGAAGGERVGSQGDLDEQKGVEGRKWVDGGEADSAAQ